MTIPPKVNLTTYKKRPRVLHEKMERDLLNSGGVLAPILKAVNDDPRLRLDIRDHRFNIYYKGGNLVLVDGIKSPWGARFDEKYFKSSEVNPLALPPLISTIDDARLWVQAFPALIVGMEKWWKQNKKEERIQCQELAEKHSAINGAPSSDYFVIDIEYQWAKRRFDLVAAKRRPTAGDALGWAKPDLVFIEVKCNKGACIGSSSLLKHTRDYLDVVEDGAQRIRSIKAEFENVITQKVRLGLIGGSLGFQRFSSAVPELLVVLIGSEAAGRAIRGQLIGIDQELKKSSGPARVRFLKLESPEQPMAANAAKTVNQLLTAVT